MYILGKKFSRMDIYEAIQVTIACVQKKMKTWILKYRNPNGGLMFNMRPKLDIVNFTIKITELGGEMIKLISIMLRLVV